MVYFLILFLILILLFVISINRKRISPNASVKYIVSPIDGYISGIHMINLDNDKKIYTEIIIKFCQFSSPYLYAPISGELKVDSEIGDSLIIDFLSYNLEKIKLYHGWSFWVNHFNYPILKKITLHVADYFKMSEAYGMCYFGNYVKVVFDSRHIVIASVGQNVIGGESVVASINSQE